MLTPFCQLMKR